MKCTEKDNAMAVGENDLRTAIRQLDRSDGLVQYIPENLGIQSTKSDGYADPSIIDEELGIEKGRFITARVFYSIGDTQNF